MPAWRSTVSSGDATTTRQGGRSWETTAAAAPVRVSTTMTVSGRCLEGFLSCSGVVSSLKPTAMEAAEERTDSAEDMATSLPLVDQ